VALDLGEQSFDLVAMRLAANRSWLFATAAWSCRCCIAANRSWCSALNNRSFATTAWSWLTAAVSVNLAVKLSEEALQQVRASTAARCWSFATAAWRCNFATTAWCCVTGRSRVTTTSTAVQQSKTSRSGGSRNTNRSDCN
jgi:hypothetical protein